jgi:hypothetical protein
MKLNSVVIVNLHSPKEKIWGILDELSTAGITLRGIDLNTFDEFVRQARSEEPGGLDTVFYPMYRVERISLDEASRGIPSLVQTFEQRTHLTLFDFLAGLPEE